jgi:hypothetical protein
MKPPDLDSNTTREDVESPRGGSGCASSWPPFVGLILDTVAIAQDVEGASYEESSDA